MNPDATAMPATIDPRYPIGRFDRSVPVTAESLKAAIATLAGLPAELRKAVAGLGDAQLDTPYREGGWTVRQLVHHIADSHTHAYIRVRLALTEDNPTINAYDENAWAKLPDSTAPVEWSLSIVDGLHTRLAMHLESLTGEDWKRGFLHPERGPMTVDFVTLLYAWHSRHHVAHITHLRAQKGW